MSLPDGFNVLDRLANAREPDDAWLAAHAPKKPEKTKRKSSAAKIDVSEVIDPDTMRNELADADSFVTDILGTAWYCAARASMNKSDYESGWLVWDGKRLVESDNGEIMRLAKKTAIKLCKEVLEEAEEISEQIRKEQAKGDLADAGKIKGLYGKRGRKLSRADQLQSENRLQKMIKLGCIDTRIHIDNNELDADPDLLNCQNGVVDLGTGEILEHDPKYRCTKICACDYNPDATSDALKLVLLRGLMNKRDDGVYEPDIDRIEFLRLSIGHGLYGHQRLQKFYINIGEGRDGKGTLFESLRPVLGDYAIKAAAKSFIKEKNSSHRIRDDMMNMAGARMIFASEPNRDDQMDGAFMKTMSGEDFQRARHLFKSEVEFKPICTIFLQTNHELQVDSADHAIWERLVHIAWGPSIPAGQRDPGLRRELESKEGQEALLAWAISGAIDTHNIAQIHEPDSVQQHAREYRERMDPLAEFILEDLRLSPTELMEEVHMPQRILRQAYKQWLEAAGLDDKRFEISGKRIGATLKNYGIFAKVKKDANNKAVKSWCGVSLRPDHDLAVDNVRLEKIPSEPTHLAQLARITDAAPVTWLPHNLSATRARAEKMPRARAREDLEKKSPIANRKRGNQVTITENELEEKEQAIKKLLEQQHPAQPNPPAGDTPTIDLDTWDDEFGGPPF